MRSRLHCISNGCVFSVMLLLSLLVMPAHSLVDESSGNKQNRVVSVAYDEKGVLISTESAVGDRYTVYDSVDPLRVIVDFSEMGIAGLEPEVQVGDNLVGSIRTTSFDLSSGRLGRVEILLSQPTEYDAVVVDNGLRINFRKSVGDVGATTAPVSNDSVQNAEVVSSGEDLSPAQLLGGVQVAGDKVVFLADGVLGKVKHFSLAKPSRLVVDVYGVAAGFDERRFSLEPPFNALRVGIYPEKLRFVFDADKRQLPEYAVDRQGNTLVVSWQAKKSGEKIASGEKPTPVPVPPANVTTGNAHITAIDFTVKQDKSYLKISLSGPVKVDQAVTRGNIIQFGIEEVSIGRQHRRTIDPSVFPCPVRLITPYTIRKNNTDEVRFAVEMKAMQPYELRTDADGVTMIFDNGPFAEAMPSGVVHKVVAGPSPSSQEALAPVTNRVKAEGGVDGTEDAFDVASLQMDSDTITIQRKKEYVGERISLVFDDADIRNILQLISEVSNLNIIVGDEVKGTLTLRLVDVPWDQALDLVLEIRELGKLEEGNVLRILPLSKIRQMQQEQFAAARAKEKLEDLVTDLVPVSYTDVEGLVDACRKRLSDRGKVIGDVRDKKLIITDIPSVVDDIKQLVKLMDTPVRQVLIEARIVEASATFGRDLGVNWGISYDDSPTDGNDGNQASVGMGGNFVALPVDAGEVAAGVVSGLTFGQVGVDKAVLDLRLAALEESGQGRIVSTPRVSTLNGEEAEVAQGTEIPYLSVSDEGTKTEFKKAELSLKVTPEINPDNSIILEIEAKNDSRGAVTGTAEAPAIDTKRATTKVLVKDGETTVIGGIFIQDKSESVTGVPGLMNVPVIGHLFKSTSVSEERRELLVFITPRILD